MLKQEYEIDRLSRRKSYIYTTSFTYLLFILTLSFEKGLCETNDIHLPTKIFKIRKSSEEIPIIDLSHLCA